MGALHNKYKYLFSVILILFFIYNEHLYGFKMGNIMKEYSFSGVMKDVLFEIELYSKNQSIKLNNYDEDVGVNYFVFSQPIGEYVRKRIESKYVGEKDVVVKNEDNSLYLISGDDKNTVFVFPKQVKGLDRVGEYVRNITLKEVSIFVSVVIIVSFIVFMMSLGNYLDPRGLRSMLFDVVNSFSSYFIAFTVIKILFFSLIFCAPLVVSTYFTYDTLKNESEMLNYMSIRIYAFSFLMINLINISLYLMHYSHLVMESILLLYVISPIVMPVVMCYVLKLWAFCKKKNYKRNYDNLWNISIYSYFVLSLSVLSMLFNYHLYKGEYYLFKNLTLFIFICLVESIIITSSMFSLTAFKKNYGGARKKVLGKDTFFIASFLICIFIALLFSLRSKYSDMIFISGLGDYYDNLYLRGDLKEVTKNMLCSASRKSNCFKLVNKGESIKAWVVVKTKDRIVIAQDKKSMYGERFAIYPYRFIDYVKLKKHA